SNAEDNMFEALERWVEKGVAPEEIVATKYTKPEDPASGVVMRRPLCAYPDIAQYKGSGNTNEATNFACVKEPGR
ncbi:MAG: tannase/feruloyl esterase family alpha/beta hydrolase, partial [Acidobacteriota bacterium]|nr:tannase/feruloyl esterase family alpha/beta hydrolase [Acidobacteriota bacterium]